MPRRSGRPSRDDKALDCRQMIIDTTVNLIKEHGADYITVRNVCSAADLSIGTFYHYFRDKDDLMMYFISELSFPNCELKTDLANVADRIVELYMKLVSRYMDLGLDFMKSFYSTGNRSLSAYMGETDGKFEAGTVMARSETELKAALAAGYMKKNTDIHTICMDICTIVKGCIFEWCLNDGTKNIEEILKRIVHGYLKGCLTRKANG